MKIPLISKIPVHSIAWSVLAGVIAGLLLVGGQYFLRDVERREQQLETKRYVDELERIVSWNPIRVVGLQAPDEMPEVRPTTKVVDNTGETVRTPIWVTNQWAPDGTIEAYLTTEVNESAREYIRFDSLRGCVTIGFSPPFEPFPIQREGTQFAVIQVSPRDQEDLSHTLLVLQRRFKEGCVGKREVRLGAWHGSVWPVRCILASPPATAATQPDRTVPGAASLAPPGRPAAG